MVPASGLGTAPGVSQRAMTASWDRSSGRQDSWIQNHRETVAGANGQMYGGIRKRADIKERNPGDDLTKRTAEEFTDYSRHLGIKCVLAQRD